MKRAITYLILVFGGGWCGFILGEYHSRQLPPGDYSLRINSAGVYEKWGKVESCSDTGKIWWKPRADGICYEVDKPAEGSKP